MGKNKNEEIWFRRDNTGTMELKKKTNEIVLILECTGASIKLFILNRIYKDRKTRLTLIGIEEWAKRETTVDLE